MASPFVSRRVVQKVLSVEQGEGQGARVRRSIGRPELRNLDPFLMLDEFRVQPPGGFPDHPHRGFETVTYMFPAHMQSGKFQHEDFCGHKGVIGPGDLQWMTAGRGIVHSEVPANGDVSHGLQLWVNLASKDKMVPPAYQELPAKDVPVVERDGVKATVIAGEALGTVSKVFTRTPTYYAMFEMEPGSRLEHPVPEGWTSFVYTLKGTATYSGTSSGPHHTLVLDRAGQGLTVEADSGPVTFVVLAGKPIGEPIVQHGPFVMNTQEEIRQAFIDYQRGVNGFEGSYDWRGVAEARKFYR